MNVATIDVGTNTTLLLVARAEPHRGIEVLEERAEITRLGRGIGRDGLLTTEAIHRTLEALRAFAEAAARHDARIVAVGTEALRRAPNAGDFLGPAARILGAPIEVVDGAREAALTFRAVAASFPDTATGTVAIIDIGGGSTEIVLATDGRPSFRTSLPLGSVRLTESFIRQDPAAADEVAAIVAAIQEALAPVPFPTSPGSPTPLVGVAGTVTSLAAMAQELATYDPARVHGYRLAREDLQRQIDRLRACTQPQRERIVGLDPRRADVILAGALILDTIAGAAHATEIRVSDHGVRWGLLHETLEAGRPA